MEEAIDVAACLQCAEARTNRVKKPHYQPLQLFCCSKKNSIQTVDSQALNTSLHACPVFLLTLLNLLPNARQQYSFGVLNATPNL
jgi:hypothetical protein